MAEEMNEVGGGSIDQYDYCELCRLNHRQNKGHVYSKKHQDILKNILSKFGRKVMGAKADLTSPVVMEIAWEAGAHFWCYFCAAEIPKHLPQVTTQLRHGGLLCHLASPEHRRSLHKFWFAHRIKNVKKKEKFLVEKEQLSQFLQLGEKATDAFLEKQQASISKEALRIKQQAANRERLLHFHRHLNAMSSVIKAEAQKLCHTADVGMTSSSLRGVRTVSAAGEGLASVALPKEDEDVGNIYTGALPPWLQSDTEDQSDTDKVIGPTAEDLSKHLALEKKKQLPANRVGAKFNHSEVTGQDWLPSFGRVWNANRRLNSKTQFLREEKIPVALPSTTGYRRKRKPTETMTSADLNTPSMDAEELDHNSMFSSTPVTNLPGSALGFSGDAVSVNQYPTYQSYEISPYQKESIWNSHQPSSHQFHNMPDQHSEYYPNEHSAPQAGPAGRSHHSRFSDNSSRARVDVHHTRPSPGTSYNYDEDFTRNHMEFNSSGNGKTDMVMCTGDTYMAGRPTFRTATPHSTSAWQPAKVSGYKRKQSAQSNDSYPKKSASETLKQGRINISSSFL